MIPSPLCPPTLSAPPDLAAPSRPSPAALDLVFIDGLRGQTVIGIHESELHRPQPLLIDLVAGRRAPTPASSSAAQNSAQPARACNTDRIADTIDYSVVRERVQRLLREHRLLLLEAFAEALAAILIDEFGALWVRVKVAKPNKFDDLAAVGVQIERWAPVADASPAPATGPQRAAAVLRLIGSGMVPGGR